MNQENKIVGIGYNGMPNKCSDDELPWNRDSDDRLKTKYPYGEDDKMLSMLTELCLHCEVQHS